MYSRLRKRIESCRFGQQIGRVTKYVGLVVVASGVNAFVGELCLISLPNGRSVEAEVIGINDMHILLMPYGRVEGIMLGSQVISTGHMIQVSVGDALVGRVIDPLCRPYDDQCPLSGLVPVTLHVESVNPLQRQRIDTLMETGISAVDLFVPIGRGQRLGIFAGSGVGKSTLLGMFSKSASADINVIAMIGERGREVIDFIEDNLGHDGLQKSVVVVATADQPPIMRVRAMYTALAIAEFFRNKGKHVLLTVDSITRFAMAMREISLSAGEPPTSRGYTPSVLSALPIVAERAGNFVIGSISALFTVLVEGDDFNEPITDTMRGVLDGHIILKRDIANKGRFPAIDIFSSNSRLADSLSDESTKSLIYMAKEHLLNKQKVDEMIELGVYRGSDHPALEQSSVIGAGIVSLITQSKMDYIHRNIAISNLQQLVHTL